MDFRLNYQLLKANSCWIEEICNPSVAARDQEKLGRKKKEGGIREFTGREQRTVGH